MKKYLFNNTKYYGLKDCEEYNQFLTQEYCDNYKKIIYKNYLNDPYGIFHYKNEGYLLMNEFAQTGTIAKYKQDLEEVKEKTKTLQNTITNSTINKNLILYRFVHKKEYKDFLIKDKRKEYFNKFISTTLTPHYVIDKYKRDKLIIILFNKNSAGLPIPDLINCGKECEILLPIGSQFKFIQYEKYMGIKIPVFVYLDCNVGKFVLP